MAQYELHADYDRDGRVSADKAEHKLRDTPPGAQIVPNVDRDDRALPAKVVDGPKPALDWTLPARLAQDNDPVRLVIRAIQPIGPDARLFLRTTGHLRESVRLMDRHGRRIEMEGFSDFPLAITGAEEEFWVETDVFGATPLGGSVEGVTEPRTVRLSLLEMIKGKDPVRLDSALFSLPQLLLLDDLAPAERLYIAHAKDGDNEPSIREVETAGQKAGVPVLRIPLELSFDDAWVQDQFQLAWCRTVKGPRRYILHLPRARANVTWLGISTNLAGFVVKHFPSKDLGLIEDFWRRDFRVTDVAGVAHWMGLDNSQHAYMEMGRGLKVRRTLLSTAADLLRLLQLDEKSAEAKGLKQFEGEGPIGVLDAVEQIPSLQGFVRKLLDRAVQDAKDAEKKAALEERRRKLGERVSGALGGLRVPRPGVLEIPLGAQKKIEIGGKEANRLYDRLEIVHDSVNFGGNIECSPPMPGAGDGKIVVGTSANSGGEMDGELLSFLLGQDAQPVVEVDTSWLKVAHVDEVVSFIPHTGSKTGFAIVRGSSSLGIALVREALRVYRNDLSVHDDHQPGRPILPPTRETMRGQHPVTMMLRGKHWSHLHPKEAFEPHEPPLLFRQLSWGHTRAVGSPMREDERYQPGPLKATNTEPEGARRYPARMSVLELDFLETGANDEIETNFLIPLQKNLEESFPGVPVLRVPLLFDEPGTAQKPDGKLELNFRRSVSSFLPNAVNFQVLGNTVLIPRQYGPRMKPEHAAEVVRGVLNEQWPELKVGKMDARWLASHGLDKCICWIREESDRRLAGFGATVIAEWFADGFPKGTDPKEVARRILAANPGSFRANGTLRDGWQRLVIPENTVDLFEACIAAVLAPSGVQIEWVDSWHYHVHGGGIHCGTNVLRRVRGK